MHGVDALHRFDLHDHESVYEQIDTVTAIEGPPAVLER
jgi:hypothetical protein